MGAPSLEGLRLALLDGNEVSLRRSDNPEQSFSPQATPDHFVESVQISEARFMGQGTAENLEFSPWFNALVGGRGTGKSTIVHFLRLAYRREGELAKLGEAESVARTFERFKRTPRSRDDHGGLRKDNSTEVCVVVMRHGERYRLRWQHDGSEPVVEEWRSGGWRPSSSQTITPERFPLRLFSQGQIAALSAEGSLTLLDVIDQTVQAHLEVAKIRDEERRFLALRSSIRDLSGKFGGREALGIQLADTRRKLDRFHQAQHSEVLVEYQLRSRQEANISRQFDAALELAKRVETLASELAPEAVPQDLFDAGSSVDHSAFQVLSRLHDHVRNSAESLNAAHKTLVAAAREEREALTSTPWYASLQGARQSYEHLVSALRSQGVSDPKEYDGLVQERHLLEDELAKLDSFEEQRKQVIQQADEALQSLALARRELSLKRSEFLRQTLAGNPFVRITLEPYGREARAIERSLREVIEVMDDRFSEDILLVDDRGPTAGEVATLLDHLPDDDGAACMQMEERLLALKKRVKDACHGLGTQHFGGHFSNYLERQYKQRPEFLDRVLMWFPEDSLRVEYSPDGDGTGFRPIGQASAGQRAAAMLAFLLAYGSEPIVLDQPEDDLDNHLIYDLVVKQIRSGKHRRQILAITHNPNIVVNGDAEMIHALDFRYGQCRVVERGCLQDRSMREEVCRVMEGGLEAFERRWKRLGTRS